MQHYVRANELSRTKNAPVPYTPRRRGTLTPSVGTPLLCAVPAGVCNVFEMMIPQPQVIYAISSGVELGEYLHH
jgi:hypothetical protein